MKKPFDHIISSPIKTPWIDTSPLPVPNIAAFLFKKLAHRDENSDIILSHDGNKIVSVALPRLRFIVFSLFEQFKEMSLKPGDTVLLASISGNNELFIVLLFTALASYGVRVFLPMFLETNELDEWLRLTDCCCIILPEQEIFALNHHEKEKSIVKSIKEVATQKDLLCFDTFKDFRIRELLHQKLPIQTDFNFLAEPQIKSAILETDQATEALLITTSGSSGRSKIVVYEHGAFIKSCLSWQAAGFYDPAKLGGRGFTPLFTHTMGVRAYFNALWTGVPVCLITTEWFVEKPEIVRYFLMQMQLMHITGGPAVYNLLLELMRTFPEIKVSLLRSMKSLVSSGAPLDNATIKSLKSALGQTIYNAYGTTETQQALSTLMYDPIEKQLSKTLGLPLPGVTIGLSKLQSEENLYRLYINSPFGCTKSIGATNSQRGQTGFFDTGDIVRLEGNNRLYYEGREDADFFKDGFGVKIPINLLKVYYQKLADKAQQVEYFPVKSTGGMASLIFITDDSVPEGIVQDQALIRIYTHLLNEINTRLYKSLEPFEYRHRHICRFVLINAPVPKTVKGTISKSQIKSNYRELIQKLVDPMSSYAAIENVENQLYIQDTFCRYHNPYVGQMLAGLGIDYAYHRAQKDTLYTYHEGAEIAILDFAGGYGTNFLGHNLKKLKQVVISFLRSDEITLSDQASIQKYIGLLAEELNLIISKITGKTYNVLFGSSGSEAVEIAIHHAVYEWKNELTRLEQQQFRYYGSQADQLVREIWQQNRQVIRRTTIRIIVLKDAFHGNSTSARALLGNQEKRKPFENLLAINPIYIDDTQLDWKQVLETELRSSKVKLKRIENHQGKFTVHEMTVSTVIAAIIEPIIGEGGVRVVNRELMNYLASLSFPLIMDEIQCGLGRSGSFLASEGINADYYLFAKTLGGNIEKISAVLIDQKRYQIDFGKLYVSTFSNGGLAAQVARNVLSIISNENLSALAFKQGKKLTDKLKQIQNKYPTVITEITGKGLMLGIKFGNFSNCDNFILRSLHKNKLTGYLFSAYLLKRHRIRILPTLSAPNILRIEPSVFITDEEIELFVQAIEELVNQIHNLHIYQLLRHLMENDPFDDQKGYQPEQGFLYTKIDAPTNQATRVAFIVHFAYPTEELRMLEKEFVFASDTGLRILFNKIQVLMEMKPVEIFARNILGGKIHFSTILIPLDSAELERLYRQGKRRKVIAKIQKAVDFAAQAGAKIISLGGYTSIMTSNGTLLVEPAQTKVITGNTLTAVVGVKRLLAEIENRPEFRQNNSLAIIGATGNIGSIIFEKLLALPFFFGEVILFGRNLNRLKGLVGRFRGQNLLNNEVKIQLSTDFSELKRCNVIITATNTNDPIIFPHHLKKKSPVLISDISVPSAVAPDIAKMANITKIPFASCITLPEDPDFVISSCLPRGTLFCCAAEAILCGLEPVNIPLKGKITSHGFEIITQLAQKYNFLKCIGVAKSFKTGV